MEKAYKLNMKTERKSLFRTYKLLKLISFHAYVIFAIWHKKILTDEKQICHWC